MQPVPFAINRYNLVRLSQTVKVKYDTVAKYTIERIKFKNSSQSQEQPHRVKIQMDT